MNNQSVRSCKIVILLIFFLFYREQIHIKFSIIEIIRHIVVATIEVISSKSYL